MNSILTAAAEPVQWGALEYMFVGAIGCIVVGGGWWILSKMFGK